MADRETRALSFGSVAADYDRYRPAPPPQALDWLIPPVAQAILDLAAGTGAVTRELIGRAPRVVAVEPDERMRAVLTTRCPQADVLAGRGEDIPLPSASVDAVVISAAWHWLDPGRAVPEITRVLRPGGRLGVPAQHAPAQLALTSVGPIDQPVVDLLFHQVGYARMLADEGAVGRGRHDQGPDRDERDNGGGAQIPGHRRGFTDQIARTPFGYDSFLPVLLEADLRPALENHHDLTGRFALPHERGAGWKRPHRCGRFDGPALSGVKDAPEVHRPSIAGRPRATEGPFDIEFRGVITALLSSLVQPVKDVPVVSSIRGCSFAHSCASSQSRGAV